ncbi:response regulator [Myxococcaceae bacterium GXIMD 01537]
MPPLRGPVLIVEDDADIREPLQGYLEHHGYRVLTARHGREALELLGREPRPSLLLLDMSMPVMDGHRVLLARKASDVLRAIPVVIISAGVAPMSPRDRALYAATYEVAATLRKPVEPQAVLEAIERHALRTEGPPAGAPA